MPSYISADGSRQDVTLQANVWLAAKDKGLSVPQFINQTYPTTADATASTFEQMCSSSGLILANNNEFGYRPPTIGAVLEGRAELNGASVADANPASRILFPAVILEMIESKLATDRATDPNAFDEMVGLDTSVSSARIEQPVINLTKAEGARSKAISQLAAPDHMLTITTTDQAQKIPTFSLGLAVSDQALQATTLDFVSMAVTRQAEVERNARVYEYLLGLLNGDLDHQAGALTALTQTQAKTYDAAIVAISTLTKKGLVGWLINNYFTRRISHIVCGIDDAMLLEALLATTNTGIQVPGSLSPQFQLMNRVLSDVKIFITEASGGWPANTMMGLDNRYAIHRIRNSAASYSAIESFVLRKSTELRFDFAELVVRMFDDAFDVLSLTVA